MLQLTQTRVKAIKNIYFGKNYVRVVFGTKYHNVQAGTVN